MTDRETVIEAGHRALGLIVLAMAAWAALRAPGEAPPAEAPTLRVAPNTAPEGALLALPDLGPARVRAIRAASEVRPIRSIDDLDRRVRGIGPVIAGRLRPHLRFDAPSSTR